MILNSVSFTMLIYLKETKKRVKSDESNARLFLAPFPVKRLRSKRPRGHDFTCALCPRFSVVH